MTFIEFLGPPGAGKSTIFTQLIASDIFYGGTEDDAVRRMFYKKAGPKHQLAYRITPSPFCNFFENAFMQYRFGHSVLEEFIRNYPDFMNTLSIAMDSVSYEPEKIFSLCRRSAEKYQLGMSTAFKTEVLCLDESFVQRALAILWRQPDELFSLENYFDTVPVSDIVIHVDAPVDVCLERQRERGRITVGKDWETDGPITIQEKARNYCSEIRNHMGEQTCLITVENTGAVDEVVEQVVSKISKLDDNLRRNNRVSP